MTFEDISMSGLDALIDETGRATEKVVDKVIKEQLLRFKANLADMRVALVELRHLDDEFKRGNVMSEVYFDRHKKLVRDFLAARDHISDVVVPNIADKASTEKDKSTITKFKDFLKNNKDFVLNASQLILNIVRTFGKQ